MGDRSDGTPKDAAGRLPLRPCVGVALINREGLVFVGRRARGEGSGDLDFPWQLPQGGIDDGETPEAAAWRELAEETGVRRARLIAEAPEWLDYDLPAALIGKAWKGRYRGQTQKWFVFAFEGEDSEIDISGQGHGPEFDLWRWARIDELPALAVPFKRLVYEKLIEHLRRAGAA